MMNKSRSLAMLYVVTFLAGVTVAHVSRLAVVADAEADIRGGETPASSSEGRGQARKEADGVRVNPAAGRLPSEPSNHRMHEGLSEQLEKLLIRARNEYRSNKNRLLSNASTVGHAHSHQQETHEVASDDGSSASTSEKKSSMTSTADVEHIPPKSAASMSGSQRGDDKLGVEESRRKYDAIVPKDAVIRDPHERNDPKSGAVAAQIARHEESQRSRNEPHKLGATDTAAAALPHRERRCSHGNAEDNQMGNRREILKGTRRRKRAENAESLEDNEEKEEDVYFIIRQSPHPESAATSKRFRRSADLMATLEDASKMKRGAAAAQEDAKKEDADEALVQDKSSDKGKVKKVNEEWSKAKRQDARNAQSRQHKRYYDDYTAEEDDDEDDEEVDEEDTKTKRDDDDDYTEDVNQDEDAKSKRDDDDYTNEDDEQEDDDVAVDKSRRYYDDYEHADDTQQQRSRRYNFDDDSRSLKQVAKRDDDDYEKGDEDARSSRYYDYDADADDAQQGEEDIGDEEEQQEDEEEEQEEEEQEEEQVQSKREAMQAAKRDDKKQIASSDKAASERSAKLNAVNLQADAVANAVDKRAEKEKMMVQQQASSSDKERSATNLDAVKRIRREAARSSRYYHEDADDAQQVEEESERDEEQQEDEQDEQVQSIREAIQAAKREEKSQIASSDETASERDAKLNEVDQHASADAIDKEMTTGQKQLDVSKLSEKNADKYLNSVRRIHREAVADGLGVPQTPTALTGENQQKSGTHGEIDALAEIDLDDSSDLDEKAESSDVSHALAGKEKTDVSVQMKPLSEGPQGHLQGHRSPSAATSASAKRQLMPAPRRVRSLDLLKRDQPSSPDDAISQEGLDFLLGRLLGKPAKDATRELHGLHGRHHASSTSPTDVTIRRSSRKAPPPLTRGRQYRRVVVHKTYTTRRGALLLFSEELAERLVESSDEDGRRRQRHGKLTYDGDDDAIKREMDSLHTVDGLAWAVLKYGSKASDSVCLDFVKERDQVSYRLQHSPRQVRPGYSAKRYLSRLTRSFDDSFLQGLINKGFVQEKTLFRSNELMPKLKRRINDDLSTSPTPYRLLKQMLISPGLLSGYSFHSEPQGKKEMSETGSVSEDGKLQGRVMKVVVREVRNGVSRTMSYGSLSTENKEMALADLLVKSALGHALSQQGQSVDTNSENGLITTKVNLRDGGQRQTLTRSKLASVGQLDMVAAVESYLQSQTLTAYDVTANSDGLPSEHGDDVISVEADDERSEQSAPQTPHPAAAILSTVTSRRRRRQQFRSDPSSVNTSGRPLYHPMTPIADADSTVAMSREVTSFNQWAVLPSILHVPETERHKEESDVGKSPPNNNTTSPSIGSGKGKTSSERRVQTFKGPVLFGADLPLAVSGGTKVASSGEQKTNSKPSTKSRHQASFNGVKRGALDDVTGSVLVLPGGEVMQIGQTIVSSSKMATIEETRQSVMAGEGVQQLLRKLSDHARDIAALVLSTPGTGQHMGEDALTAAVLWTPPTVTSPSVMSFASESLDFISCGLDSARESTTPSRSNQSVGLPVDSLAQSVIGEQMNSAAIYQDLLVNKLSSVVSQISGSNGNPGVLKNAEVDPELVRALLSQTNLEPSDICVLVDPVTGNHVISLNQQQQKQQKPSLDIRRGKAIGIQLARSVKLQANTNTSPTKPHPIELESRTVAVRNVKKTDKENIEKPIGGNVIDISQRSTTDEATNNSDSNLTRIKDKAQHQNKKMETDAVTKSTANAKKRKKKKKNGSLTIQSTDAEADGTHEQATTADEEVFCLPREDDVTSFMETDGQSKQRHDQDRADDVTNHRHRSRVIEDNDDDGNHDGGTGSGDEMEFIIVRDEFPDEDGSRDTVKVNETRPKNKFLLSPLVGLTTDSSGKEEVSESESLGLKQSGREAREVRAAQRAARAEKQRLEKEQKRREREEQLQLERSEQMRREEMMRELENERMQREEAFRIQKEQREAEKKRQEEEEDAKERKLRADAEREAKQREEHIKKMAAIRAKQAEEEQRRRELEQQQLKEEEEARQQEIAMLAQMEELEKVIYLQNKQEEEELRKQKLEYEKKRREEEDRLAMEDAVKLAQEMARQQEIQRQKMEFNQGLTEEAGRLAHMHAISRAFVFSYMELLNYLNINMVN